MQREGFNIARCTVERLMSDLDLQGVIRGKPVKTTVSDRAAPCVLDQVRHPNRTDCLEPAGVSVGMDVLACIGQFYGRHATAEAGECD